ncbi:hypothetical protein SH668x_001227 [Planctomicrobium sp. SH668]|uniref:hypothetical protein n=1 Tax=Planctomicrobium sp. SH668 TaxID=3448126 RepID=UPI003F5B29D7
MNTNSNPTSVFKIIFTVAVPLVVIGIGYFTRDRWLPTLQHQELVRHEDEEPTENSESSANSTLLLTDQAIENLKLKARAVKPETFWRTTQVPGMVVDRPGRSDRGVVSPVTGVVTRISAFPGDTVRSGEPLFSIRLLSESLHMTQSDLFKANQDIRLAIAQRERLSGAGGAIPEARIIEVENQIVRLQTAVKAYRQELLNRGLLREQIDAAATGQFVSEIEIVTPTILSSANVMPLPHVQVGNQKVSGTEDLPPPVFRDAGT